MLILWRLNMKRNMREWDVWNICSTSVERICSSHWQWWQWYVIACVCMCECACVMCDVNRHIILCICICAVVCAKPCQININLLSCGSIFNHSRNNSHKYTSHIQSVQLNLLALCSVEYFEYFKRRQLHKDMKFSTLFFLFLQILSHCNIYLINC